MRQVISFLTSLGVGALLTAAGLVIDARSLTYAGIVAIAFAIIIWLWKWGAIGTQASEATSPPQPPVEFSSQEKAVWTLKRARDDAAIARKRWGNEEARRAYIEFQVALLAIKREFNIEPLKINAEGTAFRIPFKPMLSAYIAYADVILPLLREGLIEQARREAGRFHWSWSGW